MRRVSGPILALDLATATGFAVARPGSNDLHFGTHRLPSTGKDVGAFAIAFDGWLSLMMAEHAPEIVVYEQPSIFSKTTPDTIIKLSGLAYHTELICKREGARVYMANPSKLKKFFTGHGKAKKPEMMAVARRYGWAVRDDNQADACAVWAWAVYCFAPDHAGRFSMGPMGASDASKTIA